MVGVGLGGAGPAVVVAGAGPRARHAVALLVVHRPPDEPAFRIGGHGGSLASHAVARRLVARRAHARGPAAPGGGVSR